MNLADRNYRIHGSGTDSPGFNTALGVRYIFRTTPSAFPSG